MVAADRFNNLLGLILATTLLACVLVGSYETRAPSAALHTVGEIARSLPAG